MTDTLTEKLADRLKNLRQERGLSLDRLAGQAGISRATLSRLEKGEVSPTTEHLGKLCSVYGLTLTRLIAMVEDGFVPLVTRGAQLIWQDAKQGFTRRSVSPPSNSLGVEMIDVLLAPAADIAYDAPPRPGLEHHLYLLEGEMQITLGDHLYHVKAGDCLRYQLYGPSRFQVLGKRAARYVMGLL
ncbi:helix-turn-helix domain-containing protein [Sneathiella aquimaris]|uniref:helix-turn-helix domain-containing protein n=1 Tax=Sneathiella aquimaris TaxID=2599305 RepID=UPI00146BABDA|nr:helix-turn-helix transcriptional regulator [Sneathiella aquimaris]